MEGKIRNQEWAIRNCAADEVGRDDLIALRRNLADCRKRCKYLWGTMLASSRGRAVNDNTNHSLACTQCAPLRDGVTKNI